MLRQAASRLLRQGLRGVSTSAARLEEAAAPAGAKEFVAQWQKSAPSTLSLPELPTNFLEEEAPADTGAEGDRFLVNFYTPNGIVAEKKLEQVVLPGVEGYFGVKANHVPIIAQLKPGVVELHSDASEVSKYFVSGGFAFVHPNATTDVCVLEAATLDQFDSTAVKQALQNAQAASGSDEFENAINRAAAELYAALDAAMESKT